MVITFIIGTALPELTAAELFERRQLTLVIVPTFRTVLRLIAHDAGNLHTMQTLTVSPIGEVGVLHRIPTILPTPTTANLALTHLLVGTIMPCTLPQSESFEIKALFNSIGSADARGVCCRRARRTGHQ